MTKIFQMLLIIFLLSSITYGWPSASQWIPIYKSGAVLTDPTGDGQNSRDIVGDSSNPPAYIFNDGSYLNVRLRLDADPRQAQGLGPFGWGLILDTNLDATGYEYEIIVNGVANPDEITLWRNTSQGTPGSPSDSPEINLNTYPAAGFYQVSAADSSFNGNTDYFLDFIYPYSSFLTQTGLTSSSPIRIFFGSSNNGTTLSADLLGASDLYSGLSDYISPLGVVSSTGAVAFVNNTAGTGDMTQIIHGATAYIKIIDNDQNFDNASVQQITARLTVPSGDAETVTLSEINASSSVFTGFIRVISSMAYASNGVLEAMPGETITVTYTDALTGGNPPGQNVPKTDTLYIMPPVISIAKTVNPSNIVSGSTVTYTVTVTNSGDGDAWITQFMDILPSGFVYSTGTCSLYPSTPAVNSSILTWQGNWILSKKNVTNSTMTFVFTAFVNASNGTLANNISVSGRNFTSQSSGDTAYVTISAPLISITKFADRASAAPGQQIIYTSQYSNIGLAPASTVIITDVIPAYTDYVPSSLRMGDNSSTYSTGSSSRTDTADGDNAVYISSGAAVQFSVPSLSAGQSGKVFFKVQIK